MKKASGTNGKILTNKEAQMAKIDCPCKGCVPPKRHEACHDTCQEYKEMKRNTAEINRKIAEARQIELLHRTSRSTGVSLRRKMKGENR
jgi:hypothetical protein